MEADGAPTARDAGKKREGAAGAAGKRGGGAAAAPAKRARAAAVWQPGTPVILRRVPFAPRDDGGRVLQQLESDGWALLPGLITTDEVRLMRQGTGEWPGVDRLVAQCTGPEGTKEVKSLINIEGERVERWESRWDWKGRKVLSRITRDALIRAAPGMERRWKKVCTPQTSVVLTRKFTRPQRWHMDGVWRETDIQHGLKGDWLLVFVVLYGRAGGQEGAGPDICPGWPTRWVMKPRERPTEMPWCRPRLSAGDAVVVRGSMLHRGGGGMDRGVGFVPFYPKGDRDTWGADPFANPWVPVHEGVPLREVDDLPAGGVPMP